MGKHDTTQFMKNGRRATKPGGDDGKDGESCQDGVENCIGSSFRDVESVVGHGLLLLEDEGATAGCSLGDFYVAFVDVFLGNYRVVTILQEG